MSSKAEILGALVRPPHQGEFFRVEVTTTSTVWDVPASWNNKIITLKAVGSDVQFQFGDEADTLSLTLDAEQSGTAPTLTANTESGKTLKNGDEIDYFINPATDAQFVLISSATCFLEVHLSSHSASLVI